MHERSIRDESQSIRLQPVDDDALSTVSSLMLDPPETGEKSEERVRQLESQFSAECTSGYV